MSRVDENRNIKTPHSSQRDVVSPVRYHLKTSDNKRKTNLWRKGKTNSVWLCWKICQIELNYILSTYVTEKGEEIHFMSHALLCVFLWSMHLSNLLYLCLSIESKAIHFSTALLFNQETGILQSHSMNFVHIFSTPCVSFSSFAPLGIFSIKICVNYDFHKKC